MENTKRVRLEEPGCRHNLKSGSSHTACSAGSGCRVCQLCICGNCHRCYLVHCACEICSECDSYLTENDFYEACEKCSEVLCGGCFSGHVCQE